ncbi:MAG: hypothetical protein MUC65_01760 [Pontiellaceae bacterium]|jgi:predicted HTH transcriptional regulator|nr:hypothetical protein [Pontiellaceae bacterium]
MNTGVDKTLTASALKEYGLPSPVIDTGDTWFSIAFLRAGQIRPEGNSDGGDSSPKGAPKSSPNGSPKTADLIQKNLKVSTAEIGKNLGISKRSVIKQKNRLRETGRLERVGSPRGGYWRINDG